MRYKRNSNRSSNRSGNRSINRSSKVEGGGRVVTGVVNNNNNNGHFYGARSLARARAQCAVQKAAEKCINTYNGQN